MIDWYHCYSSSDISSQAIVATVYRLKLNVLHDMAPIRKSNAVRRHGSLYPHLGLYSGLSHGMTYSPWHGRATNNPLSLK